MSSTEIQVPHPKGWTPAAVGQLQQLIALARAIEELGGSEAILALVQAEPAQAPTTGTSLSWVTSTPVTITVTAKGWTTVHVVLKTQDGHSAQCDFSSWVASLIWSPQTVNGTLYLNDWSALAAGTNYVTVSTSSGTAPLVVNGATQGELSVPVPGGVPSVTLSGSFTWTS